MSFKGPQRAADALASIPLGAALGISVAVGVSVELVRRAVLQHGVKRALLGGAAAVPLGLAAALMWGRKALLGLLAGEGRSGSSAARQDAAAGRPAATKSDEEMAAEWRWATLP